MSRDHHSPNIKHYVHLDWLSKEDGSHILTVGVGSNILMYGRISGVVNEQTSSKDGVAIITLPLGGSIKQVHAHTHTHTHTHPKVRIKLVLP